MNVEEFAEIRLQEMIEFQREKLLLNEQKTDPNKNFQEELELEQLEEEGS